MSATILLAEDDDEMRELLRFRLEANGYRVIEVEDGFEMKDYLALSRPGGELLEPDAVVTDLRMPGVDGLEALKDFPRHDRVVLISGFVDPDTVHRAHEAGVNVVLSKPFRLEDLIEELKSVLGTSITHV